MQELTKEEFKKQIIKFFELNSGTTIQKAIDSIKKVMYVDKYGNIHNNDKHVGNVRLFYTNNPNYANGEKNGYGAGWYISAHSIGAQNTCKLTEYK